MNIKLTLENDSKTCVERHLKLETLAEQMVWSKSATVEKGERRYMTDLSILR